ncbi:MAG: diaminopimelate epimerase, partial [Acidimicrobiia bacterium]
MEFVKVEALGNDFIVLEGHTAPDAVDVVRWCARKRGVGADGVLLVDPRGPGTVGMRYWNADGGEAEMCGNGLRCVARLALDRGWAIDDRVVIETAAGPLEARVLEDGSVRALVGRPAKSRVEQLLVAGATVHP